MSGQSRSYAELEIGLSGAAGAYQVELRYTDPESETEIPPVRGRAPLDPGDLLEHQLDPEAYGAALAAGLFEEAEIHGHYRRVKTAVESGDRLLRLRLRLEASAAALQDLRWELVHDPDSGDALATSEKLLFSRFMASRDWRPVKLRPRTELSALIAVSSPTDLGAGRTYPLADVDAGGEVTRARAALEGARVDVAGEEQPLTLEHLVDRLRDGGGRSGVDVLYLACHGALSRRRREPVLYLQKPDGTTAVTPGADLAERLAELTDPPRLIFLASCESGGTEQGADVAGEATAQASLAPRLAEAGVAAIVAMQGKISMTTVGQMVPAFFTELMKDGQIDRALAVARGRVRARPDAWMPALYTRLKSGRLWYEPGFAGGGDELKRWRALVGNLRAGRCIPILGPDVGQHLFGRTSERAAALAERCGFPLEADGRHDLARVSQFLRVNQTLTEARREVLAQIKKGIAERLPDAGGSYRSAAQRCLDDDGDPYHILAHLPVKVYVSAAFDLVLPHALHAAGRRPKMLFPTWRATAATHAHRKPAAGGADAGPAAYRPSEDQPVIFNAFGIDKKGAEDSLVLTEDDYLDYLIVAKRLLPSEVAGEVVQSSLLFLGFPLRGLAFRALFRLLLSLDGSERLLDNAHVGVQVDPAEHTVEDVARAQEYLQDYFHTAAPTIDVYWGDAADFLTELREQMRGIDAGPEPAAAEEDEDEWLFD